MTSAPHTQNTQIPQSAPKGIVYWITGLPGSGKSTFARALTKHLREADRQALLLDADEARLALGPNFSFSREDRRKVGAIYSRLALIISNQGYDVACATVSMFDDLRRWNRDNISNYCEIYIRTPARLIMERHPHGLYARAVEKRVRNVPGVDQYIEEPKDPDVVIDNTDSVTRQDLNDIAEHLAKEKLGTGKLNSKLHNTNELVPLATRMMSARER